MDMDHRKRDTGTGSRLDELEAEVAFLKQFQDESSKALEKFKLSIRKELGKLEGRVDNQVFASHGDPSATSIIIILMFPTLTGGETSQNLDFVR
jgi:hypothetical protein